MAQIINTNVLSLTAQRNLTSSQGALQTSLQRLSSGLRINSAKDDAAGLAISERFTTQIRGLNQAVRNANDGISLSQTAEGALAEMNNNLQRIRELAVQSANATNSSSDRTALDQEVQQRLAEINRIANQTSFNGQKILDGTFGDAKFQVGANVGETIDLSLNTSMRLDSIGAIATATSVDLDTVFSEGTEATSGTYTTGSLTALLGLDFSGGTTYNLNAVYPTVTDYSGAAAVSFDVDGETITLDADYGDLVGVGGAIQSQLDQAFGSGQYAVLPHTGDHLDIFSLSGPAPVIDNGSGPTVGGFVPGSPDTDNPGNLSFQVDGNLVTLDVAYTSLEDIALKVQADLDGATPDIYAVSVSGSGLQVAKLETGVASDAPVFSNFSSLGGDLFSGGTAVDGEDAVPASTFTVTDDFTIQLGNGDAVSVPNGEYATAQSLVDAINLALGGEATAALNDDGTVGIMSPETITFAGASANTLFSDAVYAASGDLTSVNVLTQDAANDAIYRMDSALTAVSDLRSTFGAIQNRFESTITNLSTTSENLEASRSRIRDADFAAETADLTRAQILQQAGISVLAQANAVPQSVLALLQ